MSAPAGAPSARASLDGGREQRLMAAVHAVEVADGEHAAARLLRHIPVAVNDLHCVLPPPIARASKFCRSSLASSAPMKDWISQIMIGIIVTVVGTVLANAVGARPRTPFVHGHPFLEPGTGVSAKP